MSTPTPPPAPRVATVTPVQRRVLLELMRDGAANATIGERVGLSTATVSNHVSTLMAAAGAESRVHLALLFERRQVVLRVIERKTGPRTE